MDGENCSSLNEFILLGISNDPRIKVTLTTFLVVYLIILVANLGMIILIKMDSQLHMPMYFFLGAHQAFPILLLLVSTLLSFRKQPLLCGLDVLPNTLAPTNAPPTFVTTITYMP